MGQNPVFCLFAFRALVFAVLDNAQASQDLVTPKQRLALHTKAEPNIGDDMETVEHQKAAGNGYLPGSPLYKEEQKRKAAKTAALDPEVPDVLEDAVNPQVITPQGPVAKDILEGKKPKWPQHPDEVYGAFKNSWTAMTGANLVATLISAFLSVLVVLCCAFVYMKNKVDPQQPPLDGLDHEAYLLDKKDWRFGLCDCFQTPPLCLLSFCCPTIRWSDTMRMAGIMSFYTAVTVMTVLGSLSPLTGGLTYLIMLCFAVHHRQNIRRTFGIPAGNASTYCQDCCIYTCCTCCAIVQEARQVEEAYAVNHPVVRLMAPPRSVRSEFY